jgi:streptogramin lyase
MPSSIGFRSLFGFFFAIALAAPLFVPAPAQAQSATQEAFHAISTYTGIGQQTAAIVAAGPTVGSQRLYATFMYESNTFDVLSIDPNTGNTTVFHSPVPGEYGAYAMVAGPDGNIYLGTLPHAHFLKLNAQQGTFVDLGRPSSTESYIWSMAFGSDNRLYGGTYPDCKLVRYDPSSGQLADLGRLDPVQQYAHYIAASKDGFVYAGVGPSKANIVAYRISTGGSVEILPSAAQSAGFAIVYAAASGNVYGLVNGIQYGVNQSTVTQIGTGESVFPAAQNVLSDGRTVSLAVNVSGSLMLSVNNPKTQGTATYPIAYQGQQLTIFRVGFGPDGSLYGSSILPANLLNVNLNKGGISQIGNIGGGEIYSFLSKGNSLLMGAYYGNSTLMTYQPNVPFAQGTDSANPGLVGIQDEDPGWRPEAMIEGLDGNVYVGADAGYGELSAPLMQWNTQAGSVALYDVIPNQSVVSLAAWQNLIVGGTTSLGGMGSQPTNADAELFIWNPSTHATEFQVAPVVGAKTITDLILAPNGLIYGIADTTLFEFDPETEKVTKKLALPFTNPIYNSISVDNFGRIWGLAGAGIFAVDTATFTAEIVANSPQLISGGFALNQGNIYFSSEATLYSYTLPSPIAEITVTPASTSVVTNSSLKVTVSLAGAGATPAGTVVLSGGGYTSATAKLSGGRYTFTIPANGLNTGVDTLTASYSGDPVYLPNSAMAPVTVIGKTTPIVTVSPAASSVAITANLVVTAKITGSSMAPTGTVTLSGGGYTSKATALTNGSSSFTVPASSLAVGTDVLSISYSGDSNYNASAGTARVSVVKSTATVALSPATNSISTVSNLSVAAKVAGGSAMPTGTVILSGGGYVSAAATLSGGSYTFMIPAGRLAVGGDALTLSYSGNSVYAAATATASVSVTKSAATLTVNPSSTSVTTTSSLSVAVNVEGAGPTPTGTVTLSGGGYTSAAATLVGGSYTFAIPAGRLSAGTDTLLVTYSGNSIYSASSGTKSITVTKSAAILAVNPASTRVSTTSGLSISLKVVGAGASPTGAVTLSGGGYTSAAATLAGGRVTVAIPSNSLTIGLDSLMATYSGDSKYNASAAVSSVSGVATTK